MRKQIIRIILWAVGICMMLLGTFVLGLTFSEYQPKSEETVDVEKGRGARRQIYEGDQLEILTWNISGGGMDAEMDSLLVGGIGEKEISAEQVYENLQGITDLLEAYSYDVLFLQEVDRNSMRSCGINEEQLLHQTLGGISAFAQNYRCLFVPYPAQRMIGMVNSGLQTLSRLPVSSAYRAALNREWEWPIRIFKSKPCLLVVRIPVEGSGRELVLINLQMEAYESSEARENQMKILTDLMENEYAQGNYVIAGGDFEQVFPDEDFKNYPIRRPEYFSPSKMPSLFVDWRWQFVSDRSAPTSRLADEPYSRKNWWTQLYVLDGYILSPNITLIEVETIQDHFQYSTHNPVRLSVLLQPTEQRNVSQQIQEDALQEE